MANSVDPHTDGQKTKTVYYPTNSLQRGGGRGEGHNQGMVNVLNFCTPKSLTKWHMQTVQTQIRPPDHHLSHFGFFILSCLIIYQKAVIILGGEGVGGGGWYLISTAYGTSCLNSHA